MSDQITKPRNVVKIRVEGEAVLFIHNGVLICDLPWQQALELGRALRAQAKRAEANSKPQQIADDQALLIRTGCPVGLSGDRRVIDEAYKNAQHDRDLRRYLPNPPVESIKSREKFGLPTISKRTPHA